MARVSQRMATQTTGVESEGCLAERDMRNEHEGDTVRLRGPDILIVDDNPANLDLLAEMLPGFWVPYASFATPAGSARSSHPSTATAFRQADSSMGLDLRVSLDRSSPFGLA